MLNREKFWASLGQRILLVSEAQIAEFSRCLARESGYVMDERYTLQNLSTFSQPQFRYHRAQQKWTHPHANTKSLFVPSESYLPVICSSAVNTITRLSQCPICNSSPSCLITCNLKVNCCIKNYGYLLHFLIKLKTHLWN